MGLIYGVLLPMFLEKSGLLSPLDLVANPLVLLEIIHRERYEAIPLNNFMLEHLVNRAKRKNVDPSKTYDLSCLTSFNCGGDFVYAKSVVKFQSFFKNTGLHVHRFASSWGAAETTCGVTISVPRIYDQPAAIIRVTKASLSSGRYEVVRKEVYNAENMDSLVEEEDTVLLVSAGYPVILTDLAIVNPETLERCEEGVQGEIWTRSPSVTRGYWQHEEKSRETFMSQIRKGDALESERRWMRSGDVGFLFEGQLYMTSRIKDIMIIRGRNLYPADLEPEIENCHDVMRKGNTIIFSVTKMDLEMAVQSKTNKKPKAKRSVDNAAILGNQENIVVAVCELQNKEECEKEMKQRGKKALLDVYSEAAECARKEIISNHKIALDIVVLVKSRTIPKTTSGKKRRAECKQLYLSEALDGVVHISTLDKSEKKEMEKAMTAASQILDVGQPSNNNVEVVAEGVSDCATSKEKEAREVMKDEKGKSRPLEGDDNSSDTLMGKLVALLVEVDR